MRVQQGEEPVRQEPPHLVEAQRVHEPDQLTGPQLHPVPARLVAEAEAHVPGLRQHTITRMILTPEDYRLRTHQKHHSFGGVPPVIGNKPPAHQTPIQGLWFIGAQSESTGGVPNVMLGAQKVAKQIMKGK